MFILSFLWLIGSLPIVTVGASTTAAFDCAFRIIRKRDSRIFTDFVKAYKSNFKQSTIIFLIMAVIGALLGFDLYFWAQNDGGELAFFMNAVSIGLAVIYLMTLIYVFPVQAVFENPVKKTIKTAFFMAIGNLPNSFLLVVSVIAISYGCYLVPAIAYLFFIFGTGTLAMIFSVRLLMVFKKYNPDLAADIAAEAETVEGTDNEKEYKKKGLFSKKVIK